MARWIDHAALWLFAAASALGFMMMATGGKIALSAAAAFGLVALLRYLTGKIPDGRWIFRPEKIRRSKVILRKWAMMDQEEVIREIRKLIPRLINEADWKYVRLIPRLPEMAKMDGGELLEIWRMVRGTEKLIVLTTGYADGGAFALSKELAAPTIRLLDGSALLRELACIVHKLPQENTKNERRRSFADSIARLLENIQPIRTMGYAAALAAVYLATNLEIYLCAAALLAVLTAACLIRRRRMTG